MSDLQLWSQFVAKVSGYGLDDVARNRDTANEELSTLTEYLTKLSDMCAVETQFDDSRHREHCATRDERKLYVWKGQNQGKHDLRNVDVVFGVR